MSKGEIIGYKCFKEGLQTNPGMTMELGKEYISIAPPKFRSSGFHMCERLEDTLRYFDSFTQPIDICKVIGYPEYMKYEDEYYGYYDMYSCQRILLTKKLTRKEIIDEARHMCDYRINRFLSLYKLMPSEVEEFIEKYSDGYHDYILYIIQYYQNLPKELSTKITKKIKKYDCIK